MSNPQKKVGIFASFSSDEIEKITFYSKKMGITRSALCVFFISQGLLRMDKTCALLRSISDEISDSAFDEVFNYV